MTQEWTSFLAGQGLAADGGTLRRPSGELDAARDGSVIAPLPIKA
jgi:hypothetical protein